MPLKPSMSIIDMAKEMMAAGHPKDQSFAAAYATKRKANKPRKKKNGLSKH